MHVETYVCIFVGHIEEEKKFCDFAKEFIVLLRFVEKQIEIN
jgi:hypothetical protein